MVVVVVVVVVVVPVTLAIVVFFKLFRESSIVATGRPIVMRTTPHWGPCIANNRLHVLLSETNCLLLNTFAILVLARWVRGILTYKFAVPAILNLLRHDAIAGVESGTCGRLPVRHDAVQNHLDKYCPEPSIEKPTARA